VHDDVKRAARQSLLETLDAVASILEAEDRLVVAEELARGRRLGRRDTRGGLGSAELFLFSGPVVLVIYGD
jgi:hypothetical protein